MTVILTRDSEVLAETDTPPVAHAIANLRRDLTRTLGPTLESGAAIRLVVSDDLLAEAFELTTDGTDLLIRASDDLGFVYGVYEVSRTLLGVPPFWFWNDHSPQLRPSVDVAHDLRIVSSEYAVQFRGWFVNDEVLLNHWSIDGDPLAPWEMVFEALLRLGGNVVIPGTDQASALEHIELAAQMGLAIAQHHAEPLGAEMFIRAYPGLTPSYAEHPEEFQRLWAQSIEQKKRHRVIWNLGFRGQGDRPFWLDDPQFDTDESRGALVSSVIRTQYDMLRSVIPNAQACLYLYGEMLELLHAGVLDFPDDLIKIWADNGYGRMVSRRQDNHNPRVLAFADIDDTGRNGVYYHASFYDLQAANHIAQLPNRAEDIEAELGRVLAHGMGSLWIVNCSNVKPHVYFLDLIARVWRDGSVDVPEQRQAYGTEYFGADGAPVVADALDAYARAAVEFGPEWDEHAGEQFAHHVPRTLVTQFLRDRLARADDLRWLTPAPGLRGQLEAVLPLFERGAESYLTAEDAIAAGALELTQSARTLLEDSILAQTRLHRYSYAGAVLTARSLLAALDGELERAFLLADHARRAYESARHALVSREHDVWVGFYDNDCLVDVEQSAWVLEGLARHLRIIGDGPHFFEWQRRYLYKPEDAEVLLVLRLETTISDPALARLMDSRGVR